MAASPFFARIREHVLQLTVAMPEVRDATPCRLHTEPA
jgi:hypothetical protein